MSNKKVLISLLAAMALPAVASAAGEARLLRFPATNEKEIVFSYAGDLYRVPIQGGEAQRLTAFMGYEMFPRFSPDGQTIAFTGQYDGNTEVYTIPATGGEPLRVTYTATNSRDDLDTGWTIHCLSQPYQHGLRWPSLHRKQRGWTL